MQHPESGVSNSHNTLQTKVKFVRRHFFLGLGALLISVSTYAAQVTKINGNKVLIDNADGMATEGQEYFLTSGGKKIAIIKVEKVKGTKALASVTKGRAAEGATLEMRSGGGASGSSSGGRVETKQAWGLLAGMSQNSMDVTFKDSSGNQYASVGMKGTSFNFKAFYERRLFSIVKGRFSLGYHPFTLSGTADNHASSTRSTKDCTTSVNYISLDALGKFMFGKGSIQPWAGLGFALLLPASKASNALKEDELGKPTQLFVFAAGVDIGLKNRAFIPISLEYGMFPAGDSVKSTVLSLRVGYGRNF
jgi:hypothetical protein